MLYTDSFILLLRKKHDLNIKWSKLLKKENLLTPKKDEQIKISNENQLRKVFERKKQKKNTFKAVICICIIFLH